MTLDRIRGDQVAWSFSISAPSLCWVLQATEKRTHLRELRLTLLQA